MKIAKDGFASLALLLALAVTSFIGSKVIGVIFLICFVFFLWFFRDPERTPERELAESDFLSPADGKVTEILETDTEFMGHATKIGIFMSGTDVHVNRFPCDGRVVFTKYVPGKKWLAIAPKASEINERYYVGAEGKFGRFMLVQIAGIMARRIVVRSKINDSFVRGERYGMIKLGSKVDIYLPNGIVPTVLVGQRVFAGTTIVATGKANS
ncbi:MAG: phosphatidylserine decarboxylase [Synergistaceae bacterium]|nr:phosphatidylserine decarboxylase [Synergistaceae bacterium]